MNSDGSCVNWLSNDPTNESDPTYSADAQRIAFTSDRAGNREIYVMDTSSLLYGANSTILGAETVRITDHPAEDHSPAFSPDGELLAFVTARDGNEEIYVFDMISRRATRLTDHPASDNTPAISPDGSRIALSSTRTGGGDIYVMARDGSDLVRLTDHPANDAAPAWSSDGLRIAFMSQRDGDWEIYSMNADGTQATRLTDHPASDQYPSWSGEQIAFMSSRRGDFDIYVMNADGTSPTRLAPDLSLDVFPVWASASRPGPISPAPAASPSVVRSTDGQIFFQSYRAGEEDEVQVYAMNPDGSEPNQITHLTAQSHLGPFDECGLARAISPDWSPRLGRLLFASDQPGLYQSIFSMNLDGSGLQQVSGPRQGSAVEEAFAAAWSPDGQWVAFMAFDRLGDTGVFLSRPDGSAERELTFGALDPRQVSWSPDSRRIAFADRDMVLLLDLATSQEQEFAPGSGPAWSRDGTQIALSRDDGLYLVGIDGSGDTFLAEGEAPAWSPDGEWIVFQRKISGQYDIFKIRIDGTQLTQLTDTPANEMNPDWD